MGEEHAAENFIGKNSESKKKHDAKRSLNNYLNQLKIHFDLTDEDVSTILQNTLKLRSNGLKQKKWWQIL